MIEANLTDEQFILLTRGTLQEDCKTLLQALEATWGHGFSDEASGDADAPTGHFYRCHRWIVVTDSQGFNDVWTYETEQEAVKEFEALNKAYGEWDDDGA